MTTLAKPTVNQSARNVREGGLILRVIGGATAIAWTPVPAPPGEPDVKGMDPELPLPGVRWVVHVVSGLGLSSPARRLTVVLTRRLTPCVGLQNSVPRLMTLESTIRRVLASFANFMLVRLIGSLTGRGSVSQLQHENAVLRHQVKVPRRTVRRPELRDRDRTFLAAASLLWDWCSASHRPTEGPLPSHELRCERRSAWGLTTNDGQRARGRAPLSATMNGRSARWQNSAVEVSEVSRAVAAAIWTAAGLDLAVDGAIVLHNSNKLALRLLPCDVLARVTPAGHEVAEFEVDLAQRLADTGSPVATLEPRVEPRVYERDCFAVTFWKYYEPLTQAISPVDYASTLERLHEGMRRIDVATPHFIDRVRDAQQLVASRDHTPALAEEDRKLLSTTLGSLRRTIADSGAAEQLLHGEPHPGNVRTHKGPLFIDLETCCHGPVEFDLAHVPEEVSERYPGVDQELVRECRQLVLGMVAAWRWDPGDRFPNGRRAGRAILRLLRDGPPWPALGDLRRPSVMRSRPPYQRGTSAGPY